MIDEEPNPLLGRGEKEVLIFPCTLSRVRLGLKLMKIGKTYKVKKKVGIVVRSRVERPTKDIIPIYSIKKAITPRVSSAKVSTKRERRSA